MVNGKGTSLEGSLDEKLSNGWGGSNLGLHSLLDDIPNLGHCHHNGGGVLFQGSNGISSLGSQSLGIGVTNTTSKGKHRKFSHEFHNVRKRKVTEVDISRLESKSNHTTSNTSNNLCMSNHHTLGLTGGSRSVHQNSHGRNLGWGRFVRIRISTGDKILKRNKLNSGRRSRQINNFIRGNGIIGINNSLDARNIPRLAHKTSHIPLITNNGTDNSILNGIDHRIHTQSGIDGSDDNTLRKGTLSRNHPFRTGILKNRQGAGCGNCIQSRDFGCTYQSMCTEGSTEFMYILSDLSECFMTHISKLLHGGFERVHTLVVTCGHAVLVMVGLKGLRGEFVECSGAIGGCGDEIILVSGSNTMGWIIANRDGADGFGGKEFFEGIDPSEGHDRDQRVNGKKDDL
mmetsp:Transcript_19054/g.28042  ORF Transcript_19054/g.28042 Transcript_19054/m.28042 type:complete len:400 (+) Transcript_19054:162-1361(+)